MHVAWITPVPLRQREDGVYTSEFASLRYRVLAPIQHLPEHRHDVIPRNREIEGPVSEAARTADVVIFSKTMHLLNADLAREAKAHGAAVIFDICDNHFETDWLAAHFREMASLADQVVCNTEEMARVAAPFCARPPVVIEDPYEGPRGAPAFAPGERLNLLWFGHSTNLDGLQPVLGEVAGWSAQRDVSLHVLTTLNPQLEAACAKASARYGPAFAMSCAAWTPEVQWRALAACDLVVIPSLPTAAKSVKSANRMIEALWAGRPVIAHPMPAYQPFAAWTPVGPSLTQGLQDLDADRAGVPARIAAAQAFIEARYAPAAVARKWAQVIDATVAAAAAARSG